MGLGAQAAATTGPGVGYDQARLPSGAIATSARPMPTAA